MKELTWKAVQKSHPVISGIYALNGVAKSLLCSTEKAAPYPNRVSDSEIVYCFGARTQMWGITGLLKAVESRSPLRVFHKLGVNRWHDLGYWTPTDFSEPVEGDYFRVRLVPSRS